MLSDNLLCFACQAYEDIDIAAMKVQRNGMRHSNSQVLCFWTRKGSQIATTVVVGLLLPFPKNA